MINAGLYSSMWFTSFFPAEVGCFLMGSTGYRAYKTLLAGRGIAERWRWPVGVLSAIAAAGIACSLLGVIDNEYNAYGAAMGGTMLLVPVLFYATRTSGVDRWIGNMSYPVYLVHWSVIGLVTGARPEGGAWGNAGVVLAGTLMASVAVYYAIERPIDRFRHRRFRIGKRGAGEEIPAPQKWLYISSERNSPALNSKLK
jgi:peptidoglycan/LPS O-acetylase OafA/YrhL